MINIIYANGFVMLVLRDGHLHFPNTIPSQVLDEPIKKFKHIMFYQYTDNIVNYVPKNMNDDDIDETDNAAIYWCNYDDIHRTKHIFNIPIDQTVLNAFSIHKLDYILNKNLITQYMVSYNIEIDMLYPIFMKTQYELGYFFYFFNYEDALQAQINFYKNKTSKSPGIIRITINLDKEMGIMKLTKKPQLFDLKKIHMNNEALSECYKCIVNDGIIALQSKNSIYYVKNHLKNILVLDGFSIYDRVSLPHLKLDDHSIEQKSFHVNPDKHELDV